ncbi:MAG: c-type cytochrome [Sulfuricurvum sp.]|uniref:c-type cytochrome n=1 Tax=Sulfuricurvum sp. TaxID=2025608 RepID=UPI0026399C2B|nr:c-type cytochrome [Sulfuricurvum sp.]MDD2949845.1 c-type cytochrome [Sulfuricurvum sp.]MDD5117255.1 c-type cytochrome [Sulfuricurvum sp.]
MNKTVLAAIIVVIAMLGFTYVAVGGAGGMGGEGDWVNKLAVLGAVVLVIVTAFVVTKYVRQMQFDRASGKLADENWDGIGEYKNELPFGWAIIFLGLVIWAIWYFLVGYPVNAYSQIGEYNEEVAAHDAKFEAQYANMDDATLKEMGGSIFIVQCAPCHGLQADGMDGKAANLNHRIAEASVKHVIQNGSNNQLLGMEMPMPDRNGLMNANTGALITDAEIDSVAKYVAGGMKGTAGADVFAGVCAACHGPDGKGMDMVAPNIAEFNPTLIANVLKHGKKGVIGQMPAFNNLTDVQVKALGAYVTGLSK